MAKPEDSLMITEKDARLAVTPSQPTMMDLMRMAVESGNIDAIERLAALREKELARQAEIAFNQALNLAQMSMGPVNADMTNPQTRSKYASYAALDRRVRPLYTKAGLSLSFDTADSPLPDHVRVVCFCSHSDGYTRTYKVDMPNDGKGAKGGDVMTKTHATGSAITYGMRYLLKSIFNIAIGEEDNDGNGAGMDENAVNDYLATIQDASNMDELKHAYQKAYKVATDAKDRNAQNAFIHAKNTRYKELTCK